MVASSADLRDYWRILARLKDRLLVIPHEKKHFDGHFDQFRPTAALLVTRTQFAIGARAPRVQFVVLTEGERVEAASRYRLDRLVLETIHHLRRLNVLCNPVPALALVVGLSAPTPGVDRAVLV
jgi:hypothetical protein